MHGRYWPAIQWCVTMFERTNTRSNTLHRTTAHSVFLTREYNPNYPRTLVFALQCEHALESLSCHAQLSPTLCLRTSPNIHGNSWHTTQCGANGCERSYTRSKKLHCNTVQSVLMMSEYSPNSPSMSVFALKREHALECVSCHALMWKLR